MAIVAIATTSRLLVPSTLQTRTRRKRSRHGKQGRTISKAVRQRNAGAGRPWWQPSRSSKLTSPPRAATFVIALRDEEDEKALAPEEFWKTADEGSHLDAQVLQRHHEAIGYERARQLEDSAEVEEIEPCTLLGRRVDELKQLVCECFDPDREVKLLLRLFDLELELADQSVAVGA